MIKKKIGEISVDSGQVMIIDPCYLESWKHGEYGRRFFDNELGTDPKEARILAENAREERVRSGAEPACNDYDHVCCVTVGEEGHGPGPHSSVASRTAYGDGSYPVYAVYEYKGWSSNSELRGLFIDFNPEIEEDDDVDDIIGEAI